MPLTAPYDRCRRAVLGALVTGTCDPPERRRLRFGVDQALIFDALLAFALFLITRNNAPNGRDLPDIVPLAALLSTAPLVLRHQWPLVAWRAVLAGTLFAVVTVPDHRPEAAWGPGIALVLCLYTAAVRSEAETTLGVWLVMMAVAFPITRAGSPTVIVWFVSSVALLLGYNVRARRQAQRSLAVEEARSAEEKAKRGVLEERARIARELHDVVAHHMSVIAIQAEAAPYLARDLPEPVAAAFAEIRGTALDALRETRRMLGVLRSEGETGETAPQPDLSALDDLVATARGTGLRVDVSLFGERRQPSPAVGLSAYRIIQEALSNAMRHAPGAAVRVELAYLDDALRIRVLNGPPEGPPAFPAEDGGHGLVGMRERTAMLDGELSAAPTPEGGFAVMATLPWGEPA
ncbi:sensor histidine kinase [Actinocorallia sp. B10E7]|uniref:sensor histidine kinase n=1 Tax=Actinocorallia sp. B10E7 TaxID=3153558 RepID=UPI00325ECABD